MLETISEDENPARPRKGEVFDNLYRNALEMQIKRKHPSMKTTEDKEIEAHCTFRPNINNNEAVESKIISRIKRDEIVQSVKNKNLEEQGIDDALDDLGSRLPQENAANVSQRFHRNRKMTKKSIRSSMILSDPLKVDSRNNLNTVPDKVDTSKVWGDKHAERIRKARSDRKLRNLSWR